MDTVKPALIAAATALLVLTGAAAAQGDFSGTWKVKDTSGADFEIMLAEDGSASGNRAGKGMHGQWVEKDGAAVITWSDGWTTKIAKHGDQYKKTAYDADAIEKNTSAAEKVK
jgi:hypothetical protein